MNELINLGNGQYVKVTMLKGERGSNIATITKTGISGLTDTYTITLTDGSTTTFEVTNGSSIDHIEKTSTVGSVDTYTIYLTDGTVGGTFTVNNAIATVEQNFSSTSENPLMNKTLTNIIAGVENGSTASKTYNQYDIILRNDSLYEVQTTVASGGAWADGVNIVEKTIGELIGAINNDLTDTKASIGQKVQDVHFAGATSTFVLPNDVNRCLFIIGAGTSKACFILKIIGSVAQFCDLVALSDVTHSFNVTTRTLTITHSNSGNVGSLDGVFIPC